MTFRDLAKQIRAEFAEAQRRKGARTETAERPDVEETKRRKEQGE